MPQDSNYELSVIQIICALTAFGRLSLKSKRCSYGFSVACDIQPVSHN